MLSTPASAQTSRSWSPTPAGSICPPGPMPVAWTMPRTLEKGSYGHDPADKTSAYAAGQEAAALDGWRGHDPHVRGAAVPRRTDRPAKSAFPRRQRDQAAGSRRPAWDHFRATAARQLAA